MTPPDDAPDPYLAETLANLPALRKAMARTQARLDAGKLSPARARRTRWSLARARALFDRLEAELGPLPPARK